MSILTPKQIEECVERPAAFSVEDPWIDPNDVADTLAAYAEVVQKVAEIAFSSEDCPLCEKYITWDDRGHTPECPYLDARKLRGLE